jgi:hypothetical protein
VRSTGPMPSRAGGTVGSVPLATTPETSVPAVIPKLGVGLAYQPQLEPFITSERNAFDFVEVVPDVLWNDMGPGRIHATSRMPAAPTFSAPSRIACR